MKVLLLENVNRPELTGTKGQILELKKELAEDLERHGYASYDLAVEESESPTPDEKTKSGEAEETTAKKSTAVRKHK